VPTSSIAGIAQLVAYSHPVEDDPLALRGLNGKYSANGINCAAAVASASTLASPNPASTCSRRSRGVSVNRHKQKYAPNNSED
jgi:hypothetical protein